MMNNRQLNTEALAQCDSNTVYCDCRGAMNAAPLTVEQLADAVNLWCEQHRVVPANGQAGNCITERNVRYYRSLGLLDAPMTGSGGGYGEKHRLQLIAIRVLQAQGQPLSRIRLLLSGRSLEDLREIEEHGLAEPEAAPVTSFRPPAAESWAMTALDEEFLLISRRGRRISTDVCSRLLAVLQPNSKADLHNHSSVDSSQGSPANAKTNSI
jgi:DNA-binding transcriptional MerR regulator